MGGINLKAEENLTYSLPNKQGWTTKIGEIKLEKGWEYFFLT